MEADRRDIEKEIIDICFFMRGMSIDEGYQLTIDQKKQINRRFSENQKISKQAGQLIY